MKVRITVDGFMVPKGTIMEVGEQPPRAWAGKYEVVATKRPAPSATTTPVSGDGKPVATTTPVRGSD